MPCLSGQINLKWVMSKVCQLTGKRPVSGHSVSHSNRKTKRRFEPNIQVKRFYIAESDKWIVLKVCAKAIRTINKIGLLPYIKQQTEKGLYTGVKI